MSKAVLPTTTTVTTNQPNAVAPHYDFVAGHSGHVLSHVGRIVNPLLPNRNLDIRGGVPSQGDVWYCTKDDVIFVDARDMQTSPTVTNNGKGTAADFVAAGQRLGQQVVRVGHVVDPSHPQPTDLRGGKPATMDVWYNLNTNTIFVDTVS